MKIITILAALLLATSQLSGLDISGFAEYGISPRLVKNPYGTNRMDYILNESRVQLKMEHSSDMGELFIKSEFIHDNILEETKLKLREAYFTATPFEWMDIKVGRQIQTWGVGDLMFINDMFQKDWISFFSGRSDEDLKAPSDALRFTIFPENDIIDAIDISFMPYAQSDINLQTEGRFTSQNPIYPFYMAQGMIINETKKTANDLENSEVAGRLKFGSIAGFTPTLYGYYGRFNNPYSMSFDGVNQITPYFSRLNVYGASLRGQALGGIISVEGGYYDSVDDRDGDNPLVENSSYKFLALYERSLTTTLDLGVQYFTEIISDFDRIEDNFPSTPVEGQFMDKDGMRDEMRNLVTVRLTQKLMNETLWLTWFSYISPTDEDYYFRPRVSYEYSDNLRFSVTGNIFGAFGDNDDEENFSNRLPDYHNTMFGQFKKDQNINVTMKYIF